MYSLYIQYYVGLKICILKLKCSYAKYKIYLLIWEHGISLCCILQCSSLLSDKIAYEQFFKTAQIFLFLLLTGITW